MPPRSPVSSPITTLIHAFSSQRSDRTIPCASCRGLRQTSRSSPSPSVNSSGAEQEGCEMAGLTIRPEAVSLNCHSECAVFRHYVKTVLESLRTAGLPTLLRWTDHDE